MGIKVVAVLPDGKYGWYGNRLIKNGEVFEISSMEHFSDADRKDKPPGWMRRVEEKKSEQKAPEEGIAKGRDEAKAAKK